MTTPHTQPPWTCDADGFIRDARGRIIAQVSQVSDDPDESVSNGFLIEAAPDMLAALRELAHWPLATDDDIRNKDAGIALAAARRFARAAIAKAEGR